MKEILRSVKLVTSDWTYTLATWDTGRSHPHGQWLLGYTFADKDGPIFEGEDFGCSPMHAVDSDDALRGLLSFLTLQPGDTDKEYFDCYTERQMDFALNGAEDLALYCDEEEPCAFEEVTG